MKCEKIRELILADYIDGEAQGQEKVIIETHLAQCSGCEKFLIAAKETERELFSDIKKETPPEYVWHRIKESILSEEDKRPVHGVADFGARILSAFRIPKPVFALATALTLFLIFGALAGVYVHDQQAIKADLLQQINYFDHIGNALGDSMVTGDAGFGTSIEESFL